MCTISFKERVRNEAIVNAKSYKANFMDYEYLVCSEAFEKGFHIIKSDKGNYLHLIGIHTELSPEQFFDKCVLEELEESKVKDVELIFRRPRSSKKPFKELIWGKQEDIHKYKEAISQLVSGDSSENSK